MNDYLPLITMGVLAALFAGLSFVASDLLGPRRPTSAKASPYESGIVPVHEPVRRFPVRFYLVAMIFIIFDIEIIFLYPWAVVFDELRLFGLIEMVVFAVVVVIAFAYLLSNGALDWGPRKRSVPVASGRTTDSTVRRIGRTAGADGEGTGAATPAAATPAATHGPSATEPVEVA